MNLDYQIHNCHTHIFTIDYIPKYYLSSMFPTHWAKNGTVAKVGMTLFKNTINRYMAFFYSAMKNSQMEVLKELRGYYPSNTRFSVLSVDFDYMDAGPAKFDFQCQIDDLAQVAKTVNDEAGENLIIPFLGVDPRRENLFDLVQKYVEEKGFRGLKIYPGLGFFPNDKRLYKVWEYAEKNELPITSHCIPTNKNHFRFKPTDIMIESAKLLKSFSDKDKKDSYKFAKYLNHPYWFDKLLQDFPNLKINFAHFGGNVEWDKYLDLPNEKFEKDTNWYSMIRQLLKKYPNTYSDISFTVHDRNLYPLLKNVINSEYKDKNIYSPKNKVLFGTDFYMLQKDYKERRFGIDLRGYLTEDEYWQIAEVNPKRFLATKFD
ncbi:MAG: hypothetical protein DWQ02_00645 [Bacteroidetes bacterium]|nr:MAG: hypothetical protein DWQ02_00645 [Bacteroidota bacterium]